MRDLYIEGLAIHNGPESCLDGCKADGEVLTGVRAGWVLSCEIHAPPQGGLLRGADVLEDNGTPHLGCRFGEMSWDPAQSETPRMSGCNSSGNREIPFLSLAAERTDRIGKP